MFNILAVTQFVPVRMVFEKVVGVTREIVQPAKASNFSENRLLKRASPHDTETIYQLFLIFR